MEKIAVIGMACRLPGARNISEYWRNLRAGTESIRFFAREELLAAGFDATTVDDPSYVKATPFLDGIDLFDADLFEISPREARLMDPQHRVFLETAWEALEDAGYAPDRYPGAIGLFAGAGGAVSSYLWAYASLWQAQLGTTGGFHHLGNDKDFLATRASFKLDLRGPSMTVQTACSTSMVAIHMACQSLLSGECDMALAGGVTLRVPQISGYRYEEGGIFSPDGHCRAFDAKAAGTIFGSGAGLVLLKPLDAALEDGDAVDAVILASAINNDGASKVSYTASSREGQVRAMREAFALAEVEPSAVGFVEAHGTGTLLGDPLEVGALIQTFRPSTQRRQYCALGSVKSNIGHLEGAAGVASFIKTVLALRHGEVPPSLHFEEPNPRIDFAGSPFFVPTETLDWPVAEGPRRAAVNSLGIGGTNAFVVLEEAPADERPTVEIERPLHVLTLTARTAEALAEQAERFASHLETPDAPPLADACFTAAVGRRFLEKRAFVLASDSAGAVKRLRALRLEDEGRDLLQAADEPPKVAFLFAGQAAQYVGMGKQLYETQPVFREVLERCDRVLRERFDRPLLPVLFPAEGEDSPLDQTIYAQPALFTLQMGLVEMWRSWDVEPAAVIGHSIGEIAAACALGAMSLEDGLALVAERGRLMQSLPTGGAMAAVQTDAETVAPLLEPYRDEAAIATLNGPRNTVISGTAAAVAAVGEKLTAAGVKVKELTVSHAFHSPLMAPILDDFREVCTALTVSEPRATFISALTGQVADAAVLGDADYWVRHLREPVRFADAFSELHRQGFDTFVEIGPSATLLGMAGELLPNARAAALLPSLRKGRDDWQQLLKTVGDLHGRGVRFGWQAFDEPYARRRVSLPTYPFARQRYWVDAAEGAPRLAAGFGMASAEAASFPWPGRRWRSPAFAGEILESESSVAVLPTLEDHRLHGVVVVPGAAHISLLLSCGSEVFEQDGCAVENIGFPQAVVLPENGKRTVQVILRPAASENRGVEIVSCADPTNDTAEWIHHAEGALRPVAGGGSPMPDASALAAIRDRCTEELSGESFYDTFWQAGYHLGPSFRWIKEAWRRDGEVLCRMERPTSLDPSDPFKLHPGLVDACFQVSCASFPGGGLQIILDAGDIYVPLGLSAFRFLAVPQTAALWCHVRVQESAAANSDMVTTDIDLWDENGVPVAQAVGLRMKRAPRELLLKSLQVEDKVGFYDVTWQPVEPPTEAADAAPLWLILADRGGLGSALAERAARDGMSVQIAEPGSAFATDGSAGHSQRWSFDPRSSEDARKLLQHLETVHGADQPLIVASLLPLDLTGDNASDEARGLYAACGTTLHFLQALVGRQSSAKTSLFLLTSGADQIRDDDPAPHPSQGALAGLGRVIAQEHAELWGAQIDVGKDPLAELETLYPLLRQGGVETQLAVRGGQVLAPRLTRAATRPDATEWQPSANATYLVTGGRGGLGLEVARWLAERGVAHLVLAGRSAPNEAVLKAVAELEKVGATVSLPRLDVTDREQVAEVLREIEANNPPLRGIVHAAGLIEDGILIHQTAERFAEVMAPKVAGALNLHALTADKPLEVFMLFSSVASLLGAPGQGNYAAGNAFLDALAHARRAQGLPALSLNWGPWSEIGMAATVAARGVRHWMAGGAGAIAPQEGLDAMARALGQDFSQIGVLPFDWRALLAQLSGRVPPLLTEIARQAAPKTGAPAAAPATSAYLLARLDEAPEKRRPEVVRVWIEEQVGAVLELDHDQNIEPDRGFAAMGLDSLMALDLRKRLQDGLGAAHQLPATVVFDFPTVATLSTFLIRDVLALEKDQASAAEAATEVAEAKALEELEQMSDDEAEALLLAELAELEEENENP